MAATVYFVVGAKKVDDDQNASIKAAMTNMPAGLRSRLAETPRLHSLEQTRTKGSADSTRNFLISLHDQSEHVRTVYSTANHLLGELSNVFANGINFPEFRKIDAKVV